MKLNYLCPFAQPNGVAQAAHDYCMALLAAGIDLTIVPIFACDTDQLPAGYEALLDHVQTDWPPFDEEAWWLVHAMPQDALDLANDLPGAYARILVTTWETSHIQPAWAEEIAEHFDGIITPSQHSAHAFRACQLPVAVVPHALRPIWAEAEVDVFFSDGEPYTFYSIGAWGERKNLLGLIKAYWCEFGADESVKLILKTDRMDEVSLASLKEGTNLTALPPLEIHTERRSTAAMVQLHRQSDCYVTATRGEGWNLGAFEACAMGKPVIATDWGGQSDFLREYHGWTRVIPYTLTPAVWTESMSVRHVAVGGQTLALRAIESVAPKGVDGRQLWAQPDLRRLQIVMRQAYARLMGRGDSPRRRDEVRGEFAARYSYSRVGRYFLDALKGFPEAA